MNKEFIEKIENKVNSIDILDKDPFVEESCKNIYRALLIVAENENPPISDISDILNDANKTIELLKKFNGINKEKYNGELSYIVIDVNNNQTLLYLIELLRQSMNITTDSNSINKSTDLNTIIDKFLNNEISATEIEEDINTNKIKFSVLNSKQYGEITRPLNKRYYDIFGKGITFYEDKGYPSREKCFISLLKAIENKKEVEYYYNEYLQGNNSGNNKKINLDDININRINKILSSVFLTSQIIKIEKIDSIKFLPSQVGYTIEIKDNHDKFYYMFVDDEYCYVGQVRENSIDGKIVYIPDDDYIPPTTNDFNDNKNNDNELNNNSPMSKIKNFFHINSKNSNDVTKFAQEHGYKGAKYIGNWKEYKVYEPYVSGNDISFTGLPLVILVNDKGEIRMSTSDEAMATLDDKSFIESFEENKIKEEKVPLTDNAFKLDNLSPDQASNLINNIDGKIAELQIEKEKIDKEIAENLDEVSKYSILNKNLDELLNAKKKFINDWDTLLFNTSDEHWIMNSSTYRVHIVSIINAILRREQNNKSTEQLELLNKITECFGNKDRDSAITIVKQLKEIESR